MGDDTRKRETVIDVVVNEPEIRAFVHKAKYHDVELFSYIGGFMRCWLGISIWSLFYNLLRIRAEVKLKEKLRNSLSFKGSKKEKMEDNGDEIKDRDKKL